MQWPLCPAQTWHGDRNGVPLSLLQTNKNKQRGLLALFASSACHDYFGIHCVGKCAGVTCPMLVRAAGTPLVPNAVSLPARRQMAPAQRACALPHVFSMNPRPDFPHVRVPPLLLLPPPLRGARFARSHASLYSICKREHLMQRSCVL